ncbi:urease accessory protein UreD [Pseudodonghicola flavimaris]|uniref:Urease accessory protein UreD n=1 Tax=Pseudodonghicola flavimaris TaxID=3050036 RepID=A0ABT7F5I8_9RHOB|nr:urease accessory protein UreD [Pseudodonghicola flavimaris]MDK3019842.1 urease accessory protein UreD [Pseudodonghicola flavimaris]
MPQSPVAAQPRAEGQLTLSAKRQGANSVLDRYRPSGAMKAMFPRRPGPLQAIAINSAGGITGGDRLAIAAEAGPGAHLILTTQAAERAYRAASGWGRFDTELRARAGSTLFWLPQELILYQGAALSRSLTIALEADARLLMVEPVIFGRTAMGERLTEAAFRDRIAIDRDGKPLYRDGLRLEGDLSARLARAGIGGGGGAMASVLYVAPDADAHLAALRAEMPPTGGATLLRQGVLAVRLIAEDGFHLRRHLLPVLDRLSQDTLPTSWRL